MGATTGLQGLSSLLNKVREAGSLTLNSDKINSSTGEGVMKPAEYDIDAAITEDWRIQWKDLSNWSKIGGGNFGNVYKATYKGQTVAIKELVEDEDEDSEQELDEDEMALYYVREMACLKELDHPNIVKLLGLCKHEDVVYIITEFVGGGDLRQRLKDRKVSLSWLQRAKICRDICRSLAYLHQSQIMHRDLKSKNLLVRDLPNGEMEIAACDFGFARKMAATHEYMTLCGTDEWMAPEVMLGQKYDAKADVYSFGMVMIEVITREKPIQRQNESSPYDYEKFKNMTSPQCPYELFKITILCSQFYPVNRPTTNEALQMLEDLVDALESGPVKSIADIQAEMAQAEQSSSSDADSSFGGSEQESSSEEAGQDKLTMQLEEDSSSSSEQEVRSTPAAAVAKQTSTPVQQQQQQSRGKRDKPGDIPEQEALVVTQDSQSFRVAVGQRIRFLARDDAEWVCGVGVGWLPAKLLSGVPLGDRRQTVELPDLSPPRAHTVRSPRSRSASDAKGLAGFVNKLKKTKDLSVELEVSEEGLMNICCSLVHPTSGVTFSNHKKMLKVIPCCATGHEICDWLQASGSAPNFASAIAIFQFLLTRRVLIDVRAGKKMQFDKNALYQAAMRIGGTVDLPQMNECLTWGVGHRDGVALSFHLSNRFGKFFKSGVEVLENPKDLLSNGAFARLVVSTCELQMVNISTLSDAHKLVFWLNVHNCLVMHALAIHGYPHDRLTRRALYELPQYTIGGLHYSARLIENFILTGKESLEASDPRSSQQCIVENGLHLLGLCDNTPKTPRHRAFSVDTFDRDVTENLRAWLHQPGVVAFDPEVNSVTLPKVFKTYGKHLPEVIPSIEPLLPAACSEFINLVKSAGTQVEVKYRDV